MKVRVALLAVRVVGVKISVTVQLELAARVLPQVVDRCVTALRTTFLPSDFRSLNAVGSIFTDSLNVPERILTQGLPGSTPQSNWFGVDYCEFWVTTPGKYEFAHSADDGADLYIDDHRVINDDGIHPPRTVDGSVTLDAGRHMIHLPYFQGPTYVSLVLQVKAPGRILDIFDIRDFARPRITSSTLK